MAISLRGLLVFHNSGFVRVCVLPSQAAKTFFAVEIGRVDLDPRDRTERGERVDTPLVTDV